jgi:hypothetical protein
MPCDYSKYPSNWKKEIRPRILERAENRCELCGAANKEYGYRGKDGAWFPWQEIEDSLEIKGIDLFDDELSHHIDKNGFARKGTYIVLTIAHWHDHNPMNCEDNNLKAACQYCHLNHDKEQHQTNARLTRESKAGLQRMF